MIVVCPCTLAENWRREANALGFIDPSEDTTEDNLCFIKITSWAKVADPDSTIRDFKGRFENFVVVFDEAHAMQNLKSQRTQASLKLSLHR